MNYLPWSLTGSLVPKSVLSDSRGNTPACFWLEFVCLHFHLCPYLKRVSYRLRVRIWPPRWLSYIFPFVLCFYFFLFGLFLLVCWALCCCHLVLRESFPCDPCISARLVNSWQLLFLASLANACVELVVSEDRRVFLSGGALSRITKTPSSSHSQWAPFEQTGVPVCSVLLLNAAHRVHWHSLHCPVGSGLEGSRCRLCPSEIYVLTP